MMKIKKILGILRIKMADVKLFIMSFMVRVGLNIIIDIVHVSVSMIKKVIGVSLGFIKKIIGVIIDYLKTLVKRVLNSIMLITLDKLFGLLLGAIFLASLKYAISGCLSVN